MLGAYFLALRQLEKTGSCFWANLEPAAKGGSRAGHRPPTERNMPVSTPSLAAHAVPLPTLTPHWGSLLGAPVSAPGLCANATFAGVSGRGLRPCPTLCHVRCPHSISCVGLIYRSQARSPGPGVRPTSLTSCTTSRGSTCAPLPQHHAQATRAGSERAHAILSRSVSILLRRGCKRAHLLPRTLTSLPHPQLPERERKGSVRARWQRLARHLAAA